MIRVFFGDSGLNYQPDYYRDINNYLKEASKNLDDRIKKDFNNKVKSIFNNADQLFQQGGLLIIKNSNEPPYKIVKTFEEDLGSFNDSSSDSGSDEEQQRMRDQMRDQVNHFETCPKCLEIFLSQFGRIKCCDCGVIIKSSKTITPHHVVIQYTPFFIDEEQMMPISQCNDCFRKYVIENQKGTKGAICRQCGVYYAFKPQTQESTPTPGSTPQPIIQEQDESEDSDNESDLSEDEYEQQNKQVRAMMEKLFAFLKARINANPKVGGGYKNSNSLLQKIIGL